MKRKVEKDLINWHKGKQRKPLVLRGARQVGKTWLVRQFAKAAGLTLVEINLEREPQLASLFTENDPKRTFRSIQAAFNLSLTPKKTLLFLDEIQVAPELLAKLRWFAEEFPELAVIAAGSLLEFALADHTFSMPVGRITYMYLEPLSFEEFMMASGKGELYSYLAEYKLVDSMPQYIHESLSRFFKEYVIIGGMPAAVAAWVSESSLSRVSQIHRDLLSTYRDDFSKYSKNLSTRLLDDVMVAVPTQLGHKFIYSKVKAETTSTRIKEATELLCKARICHWIRGCSANGVPLGAELQERMIKVIFLDVGLCSALLGLSLEKIVRVDELSLINKGATTEQVTGQLLRCIFPSYIEPSLYYWQREEKGSSSEIDYVLQHGRRVVPVEVKAGTTGSLKSLHLFMHLKRLSLAVRVNSDLPSKTSVDVKTTMGDRVQYELISLPFYILSELPRLLTESEN